MKWTKRTHWHTNKRARERERALRIDCISHPHININVNTARAINSNQPFTFTAIHFCVRVLNSYYSIRFSCSSLSLQLLLLLRFYIFGWPSLVVLPLPLEGNARLVQTQRARTHTFDCEESTHIYDNIRCMRLDVIQQAIVFVVCVYTKIETPMVLLENALHQFK